ncbi:MAG: metal-dependent hydrolase [Myxococcales bacterium]|nr:metal-dependent hydrolase [Myxococcales bacterium]
MAVKPMPAGVEVKMRRMRFELDDSVPVHWFRGNAFLTHFFNAMSSVFPEGEKFFIDSVRHFEPRIDDPLLRDQIREFSRQEGHHTYQHRLLNDLVERQGFPMKSYDQALAGVFNWIRANYSPLQQLAFTAAIEHFTAMLGDQLLRHPELLEGADPRVAPLWSWHAVEETEHKAVAFDVYQRMGGDYRTRAGLLAKLTVPFLSILHRIQADLLGRDPSPRSRFDSAIGLNYLWGRPGFLRRLLPDYLRYYRPSFHPWQIDNSALIERWKADNRHYVQGGAGAVPVSGFAAA